MEQKVDNTDFEKDNGLKILKEAKKKREKTLCTSGGVKGTYINSFGWAFRIY